MTVPPLRPRNIATMTGDYTTGKSTILGAWVQSIGAGVLWAAPPRMGAKPDFSSFAAVVHNKLDMERACREHSYVVWPSPPSSHGVERIKEAFNDFNEIAMRLQNCVVVWDELQRITEEKKGLYQLPPRALDVVELGHKDPGNLAKVFCAHRAAQIPNALTAGAYRLSTRPFPGDEEHLEPFFGREGVRRMKRFGVGDFAFYSAETGPVLPCRLADRPPRAQPQAQPQGETEPGLLPPSTPTPQQEGHGQG